MMKPESVWGAIWYVHRRHYNCKEPHILQKICPEADVKDHTI